MAQLARTDFLSKWKAKVGEDEVEFLEDMADSFPETKPEDETSSVNYEDDNNPYKKQFEEMKQKYIDRFMGGTGGNNGGEDNTNDNDNDINKEDIILPNGVRIDSDIFDVAE